MGNDLCTHLAFNRKVNKFSYTVQTVDLLLTFMPVFPRFLFPVWVCVKTQTAQFRGI